ncbi:hypothetical protein DFJ77DRAFT_455773 [Powellomyces hirtus]|nr:hypothetical protein DFJ77DRAFT_455773 [Powellomyces hirtus]
MLSRTPWLILLLLNIASAQIPTPNPAIPSPAAPPATSLAPPPAAGGQQLLVSFTPRLGRTSAPLAGSWLGLSIEWTHVDDALGTGVGASQRKDIRTGPIVAGLLESLRNSSGGWPIHIRIGGNSATRLWWQGSTLPRNPQSLWMVIPEELAILQQVAVDTFSKFVITVPMLNPDPAYAVEFLTQGILRNIAPENIFAIEIGNEPDHYVKNQRRPPTYAFPEFNAEYTNAYNAITAAIGNGFEYQGPAYAYPWTEEYFIPFIQTQKGTKFVAFHKYGQQGCSVYTNPNAVTPLTLMQDPEPEEYEWLDAIAQTSKAFNKTLVWGEGGSSSCNGTAGVSDTYVSALWTVDMALEMAYRGIQYGSISGAGQTYYAPYAVDESIGRVTARPTFYGMVMVQRILRGANSRVFRAPMDGGWATVGNSTKTWGVLHSDGSASLVIITKEAGAVSIKTANVPPVSCPNGAAAKGFVSRMSVLSSTPLTATTGITVNGQTWDGSLDGRAIGDYVEESIDPKTGIINVPGYSIAVLRVGCDAGMIGVQYTPPVPAPFIPATEPGKPGWTGNGTSAGIPGGAETDANGNVHGPKVGALVGIGIAAAVVLLGGILTVLGIQRRRRATLVDSNSHPHPYARNSAYLGKRGGEMV